MFPLMAPEMVTARVEELRRESDAGTRRAAGARFGLRWALGVRLVSLGSRLLGEPVRIERAEAG